MVKINFKGLIAQWKNRYRLLPVAGAANLYDLVPERGTVTQEGDEITAESMNQLQANVEQAIDDLQESVAQDMADLEAASGEALKQAQAEADTRYSNALTGAASGAMAHMTDVSGIGSLRRLAVLGETAETGTGDKGPDNPYAVTGLTPAKATACGKNLLDWLGMPAGTTVGTWKYSGVTAAKANAAMVLTNTGAWGGIQTILPVNPGQKYSLSILADNPSGNGVGIAVCNGPIYDSQKLICNQYKTDTTVSLAATIAPSESYITVKFTANHQNASANGTVVTFREMQIEQGTAATAYEPYTGATVTLPTLEPLYGDGTINDEYDAATGIETRRWKRMELDGTESGWRTSPTEDNTKLRYVLPAPDALNPPTTYDMPDITCTHYAAAPPYNNWRSTQSVCVSSGSLVFFDTAYGSQDLAAWKSYLAAQKTAGTPVTVVYQLAEPVVTQRDPARVIPPAPMCNVYADQGDVDVTYNRDINMAFAALETAMKTLLGGA